MKHLALLVPYERLRLLKPDFYSSNIVPQAFNAWKELQHVPYVCLPIQVDDGSWILIVVNACHATTPSRATIPSRATTPRRSKDGDIIKWFCFHDREAESVAEVLEIVSAYFVVVFEGYEVEESHRARPRDRQPESSVCVIAEFEKIVSAIKRGAFKNMLDLNDVFPQYYGHDQLRVDAEILINFNARVIASAMEPICWGNWKIYRKVVGWWPCVLVSSTYDSRLRANKPSETVRSQVKDWTIAWFAEDPGNQTQVKRKELKMWDDITADEAMHETELPRFTDGTKAAFTIAVEAAAEAAKKLT